jgi:hypothetical protein
MRECACRTLMMVLSSRIDSAGSASLTRRSESELRAMKRASLECLTLDELIERFAEIGIAQDEALFCDQYGKFNRLYDKMQAIDDELRRRGRDARIALQRLYNHPNMQVRLKAATRTLAVAPAAARGVLQAICDSKLYPQAGDAGMTLVALDDGTFKPN